MWHARVWQRARRCCVVGRPLPRSFCAAHAEPVVRSAREARRWLLPACTGAAGAVCLVFIDGPVLAKTPQTRQEVYVWGRSQAVPGGSELDIVRPTKVEWFERNPAGWAKISFGPDFGAALDRRGQLYVWGEGAQGGPPVGPCQVDVKGDARGHKFVDVQCSSTKIVALTQRGHTFFFDTPVEALAARAETLRAASDDGDASQAAPSTREAPAADASLVLPSRTVPGLPQPGFLRGGGIRQMSIGLEHAAFVSSRGELFCIGGSQWGQCGVEPPKQKGVMGALEERARIEVTWPHRVEFPESAGPIVSVAVGGRHTIAMDNEGKTYSFGDDRRIQLGLGDTRSGGTDDRHSLGVLNRDHLGGLKPKAEIKRRANYRYYDPHMQSSPVETLPPLAYNRPPYPPPSFVACGEDFTLALHRDSPDWYSADQETNLIFCSGENGFGQCGRSLQQQQQAWCSVRLPKRSRVVAIACGQAHSLALLSSGELYSWGANFYGQVGNGTRACVPAPGKVRFDPPKAISPRAPGEEPVLGPTLSSLGTITHIACGFRNSAVIIDVPVHD